MGRLSDLKPTRKVGTGGLSGLIAEFVVLNLRAAGVEVPVGYGEVLAGLIGWCAAWYVRETQRDYTVTFTAA